MIKFIIRKDVTMDMTQFSHDDLLDVIEMTDKLEDYMEMILIDNERHLAMSALISATINSMLGQCNTIEALIIYRNLFVEMLDRSIRSNISKDND